MNKGFITGNLTRDAETKYIERAQKHVIEFSIANNDEQIKKPDGSYEDVTSFFNCTMWSKTGKIANHLLKGKKVVVEYKLKQDRFQDKDGNNRSTVKLNCVDVVPFVYEKSGESSVFNELFGGDTIGNSNNSPAEPF